MRHESRRGRWADHVKTETGALYFAVRDPRTPWYAKALGVAIVAYALSPIDLIPDFIPVIGYLDDLLIVPAGLWLVRRMVPPVVLADARVAAARLRAKRSRKAAVIIVGIWVLLAALAAGWVGRLLR